MFKAPPPPLKTQYGGDRSGDGTKEVVIGVGMAQKRW